MTDDLPDPGSAVDAAGGGRAPGEGAGPPDDALPADAWLTLPDVAERLGLPVTRVRQLIREGALIALRPGGGPLRVPAAFVAHGAVLKGLPGLITVLRDGGYDDVGVVRWLYTPDASLPGTPVQALVENRATEVKRRAQALAL